MFKITQKLQAIKEFLFFSNWPILMAGRLPFFKSRFAMYQKDNISFITDYKGGDSTGARHLLSSGLYEDFINFILNKEASLGTLLDVGANNGGFILDLFRRLSRPPQKIVAIEFNYMTYLRLQFNVLYNAGRSTEIQLVNGAAAGVTGWLDVEDNDGSTGNNIYKSQSKLPMRKVPAMTFDDVYGTYFNPGIIDLCKVDIEGAEYEFLADLTSTKLACVKYLVIEIHSGKSYNPQELIDRLISRGFILAIAGNAKSPEVYLFKNNMLS